MRKKSFKSFKVSEFQKNQEFVFTVLIIGALKTLKP